MDRRVRWELIVKNALEVLQNVLPTNIMDNLDRLDDDEDEQDDTPEDLDEDRFFHEYFTAQNHPTITAIKPETLDTNDSLTYFEIVEQEMMESLPITKENIEVVRTWCARMMI